MSHVKVNQHDKYLVKGHFVQKLFSGHADRRTDADAHKPDRLL